MNKTANNSVSIDSSVGLSMLTNLPANSNETNCLTVFVNSVNNINQSITPILNQMGFGTSTNDLSHDAELLESSTKRNDKYTVRRILDVHYSHFRIKRLNEQTNLSSETHHAKSTPIPDIFFNILHTAIENNSLDVLRICLKYGINPNEHGTTENINKSRFKIKCNYCKQNPLAQPINPDYSINENDCNNKIPNLDRINYSSSSYLISLPPLFLSISKCNHSATELLLTYNACPNIQDEFGNTPLHLAVAKREPCRECVYLLLKNHATSLVYNNRLQSPLSVLKLVTESSKTLEHDLKQTKWDYSISTVYSSLIQDLFKNLDLIGTSSKGLSMPNNTESSAAINNNVSNNQKRKNAFTSHFGIEQVV